MNKLRVVDLFSGCGGFSIGFEERAECDVVLAVDKWEISLKTLNFNFPTIDCMNADLSIDRDARRVTEAISGNVDILIGGPPCQGFSSLGKRRDGDARSTLVDTFASLCIKSRPKIVKVENVRGITTKVHPAGISYAASLANSLTNNNKTQYVCSSKIINAADYGVPQNRLRWFMVGVRTDIPNASNHLAKFWAALDQNKSPTQKTLLDAIGNLPSTNHDQDSPTKRPLLSTSNGVIHNHTPMRHSPQLVERLRHIPPGGGLQDVPDNLLTPHLRKMLQGGYGSGGHVKNIYGRMDWSRPSGTIVAGIDKITCGRFIHPVEHRLLTPRECARIQSFPDDFEILGGQVAQYYQIGNAVPPHLAAAFADAALHVLRHTKREVSAIYPERIAS